MKNSSNTQMLQNVALLRPLLIVLLVFYHAFAPYSRVWKPIPGYADVPAYWWLDKLSYAFMLEMFVFVSGYVFGYQVRVKGEDKLAAKSLLWGKFRRLIIPSLIFSLLYVVIFQDIAQPVAKTVCDVINGVGHMWFLPMLFWCFAGTWLLERLHVKHAFAVPLLLLVSLKPVGMQMPLQLDNAMYYMVYFYVGYVLQRDGKELSRLNRPSVAAALVVLFSIAFPSLTIAVENPDLIQGMVENPLASKVLSSGIYYVHRQIYASIGIAMALSLVGIYLDGHTFRPQSWVMTVGKLSMSVYLLQQFILVFLYGNSVVTDSLGTYSLPWFGFAVSLTLSLLLSWLLSKTKIWRFAVGG